MKIIKENEYFQVGETIFQYIVVDGKHKLIPTKKVVKKTFIPPTLDQVKAYFKEEGYNEETAIKFYEYYSVGNWKDNKENQVNNWKRKAVSVWFRQENRIKEVNIEIVKKELNGEFLF